MLVCWGLGAPTPKVILRINVQPINQINRTMHDVRQTLTQDFPQEGVTCSRRGLDSEVTRGPGVSPGRDVSRIFRWEGGAQWVWSHLQTGFSKTALRKFEKSQVKISFLPKQCA